jgi:HD-GYP domain-containing protein (c-di-GMP phosphodiesterase class II)
MDMGNDLIILKGKLYNKSFPLSEGKKLLVGRGHDVDIQIFETGLSRHHACFERCNGEVFVSDLGSSNGTLVNEERVTRRKVVTDDIIRFGVVEFTFADKNTPAAIVTSSIVAALPKMGNGELKTNIQLLYGTVRALIAALEAKDEYTRGHSERVTAYGMHLGRVMNLPPDALNALELGGFLHDIGKIGIPERILHKPDRLTDEEYAIIKQHPRLGYGILSQIEGSQIVGDVVLHHHERWDGKGYPDGLAGEGIPFAARILGLADAFDAMGSTRPYRSHCAKERVIEEIRKNAGQQFDPKLAEVFLSEVTAGRISVEKDLIAGATMEQQGVRL